jgi:hypothetical protein
MTSFYIVTSYYTKYTKVFFPLTLSNFISVLNIAEIGKSKALKQHALTKNIKLFPGVITPSTIKGQHSPCIMHIYTAAIHFLVSSFYEFFQSCKDKVKETEGQTDG